jgi:hypothetical protein
VRGCSAEPGEQRTESKADEGSDEGGHAAPKVVLSPPPEQSAWTFS